MNDFLQQFLIESREFIAQATEGLLQLEKAPHDTETLDTVFRAFHTLKGGAGIVEFAAMESALHATESLLTDARNGKLTLTAGFIGDCLACLDQVSQWLDMLEQTGELPQVVAPQSVVTQASDWEAELRARHKAVLAQAATAFRFAPSPDSFYKGEDPLTRAASLNRLLALDVQPANPWPALKDFDPYTCNLVLSGLSGAAGSQVAEHFRELSGECDIRSIASADSEFQQLPQNVRKLLQEQVALLDVGASTGSSGRLASAGLAAANALRYCGLTAHAENLALAARQSLAEGAPQHLRDGISRLLAAETIAPSAESAPAQPSPARAATVATATAAAHPKTGARTMRVNVEQIDALVRLTGELTVAKNAVGHTAVLAQHHGDATANLLKDHRVVLDRLIAQLQNAVIGMRVLPLRTVFQRFPRVLREMSLSLGKPTQLQLEGEETEADKAIVEMLFEPLLHVIRNAIDHGIEDPQGRSAAGKPAVGTIRLRAARDGNQVLVEVADDGAGIDIERLRTVARQRGVADEQELAAMSDSQAMDLIFAPGFSTAARVTEISGRGVGMDAVRTAVEQVGGRVSIDSRLKLGTTVSFSLPYSVMMTQVMTVEAGGQTFGIPLEVIVETVGVAPQAISGVGEARVIVHRNRTIPVVALASALSGHNAVALVAGDATLIIASVAGQLVGLQVDRPGERMEVILKPLDGLLADAPGVAGTTVLGDGRVLLVLDVAELLQ